MKRRVLSVLLALVLMFSAIAEETPQAETPVEEIVDEQIIQEAETQDETNTESGIEKVEEKPAERCVEVVSEAVTLPAVETATENVSEVTVNEPKQEDKTESVSSDIQVDNEGSGKSVLETRTEQETVQTSENALEIESESDNKDVQIEEVKDEDAEEEQTVQEVPDEDTEEADENTGVDDDTTEQTSETESKLDAPLDEEDAAEAEDADTDIVQERSEEKVNEDELGEQPVESDGEHAGDEAEEEAEKAEEVDIPDAEKSEPEAESVEDGSKVETEADSEIETVEELDGSTVDDVSGGDSVLTAMPALTFASVEPQITTSRTIQTTGRTVLYSSDANNTDEFVFHAYSDDAIMEFTMWINGEKQWLGIATYWCFTEDYEYKISYKKLYSLLDNGTCTIKVRFHCNKSGDVYNLEKEITFTKFTVTEADLKTITCSVTANVTGNLTGYPGDDGFTINAITSWSGNSNIQTAVSNGELTLTHTLYVCYDNGEWEEQGDPTKMSYNYVEMAFHEGMHTSIQYKYVISW